MERKPSGWTSPSSLLGILGFAAIVYGGYLAFQENVGDDISSIESRLAVLETTVKNHEKQIDRLDEERRGERRERDDGK